MNGTKMELPSTTPFLIEINSVPIYMATVLESVINIFNVFSCIYLISKLRKTRLMHVNLKTMLISISVTLILFNCFRFIKSLGYFLLQSQDVVENYQIFFYNRFCVINRFFYDTTVNVLSLTMLGLIFERTAATCFVRVYEKTDSSLVAKTIVIFQWTSGIVGALIFLLIDQSEKDYWNSSTVLVTCSFVYTRPEYKENVTTLTFLVPMFTVFGISNIISTALIAYMFVHISQQGVSDKLVDYLWKIEKAYNATISIYTIFFVLICTKLHHPLRESFLRDSKWLCRCPENSIEEKPSMIRLVGKDGKTVEGSNEGDVYFKTLRETWG
ncbi:hypothetical protein FO519_006389 [Halicephalobus sp. NKZ332]|nr:hypothetical protein FO519_006389 [Halicephalobus sp. NKZ332]